MLNFDIKFLLPLTKTLLQSLNVIALKEKVQSKWYILGTDIMDIIPRQKCGFAFALHSYLVYQ